jgi:hypothetical protein
MYLSKALSYFPSEVLQSMRAALEPLPTDGNNVNPAYIARAIERELAKREEPQ